MPGATTCWNWAALSCGMPCWADYVLTSDTIVGEAYASMIATVWPEPSYPSPERPYAPRSWAGV